MQKLGFVLQGFRRTQLIDMSFGKDLYLREEGEPNQWLIHDTKKWLLSLHINGELTVPQQKDLMETLFPIVEHWRAKQRFIIVKLFRVKNSKDSDTLGYQLSLVVDRYFDATKGAVTFAKFEHGDDFVKGFSTLRIEGYERH